MSVEATGIPGFQPGDPISNEIIERSLDAACNAIVRRIDTARQSNRKAIDVDGQPGRELELDLSDGGAGLARVLIWKARFFVLVILDKRGPPDPAIVEKFWGGFVMK
jgi:hypothetical protein